MTDCPQCERLRAENKTLREALERLRRLVVDMGGAAVMQKDTPYEDERVPEWIWEKEDEK